MSEKLTEQQQKALHIWSDFDDWFYMDLIKYSALHTISKQTADKNVYTLENTPYWYGVLISALKKIGPVSVFAMRGVNTKEDYSNVRPGTIIKTSRLTSYTTLLEKATMFAEDGPFNSILFEGNLKTAVPVAKYSQLPEEDEHILLPGALLEVLAIERDIESNGKQYTKITVQEK